MKLKQWNDPSILQNVESLFNEKQFYFTVQNKVQSILLSINPFEFQEDLFQKKLLDEYANAAKSKVIGKKIKRKPAHLWKKILEVY